MSEKSDAIVAEAAGSTTVTVTWRDMKPFEVPIYRDDWSFEAVFAAEQGRLATLVAALLPDAALSEFRKGGPTQADTRDLVDKIGEAMDLAAGESSASAS